MKKISSFFLIVLFSWFLTLNHLAFAQEECDPAIEKQSNGEACSTDACQCISGLCVNGFCADHEPE